MFLKQQGIYVLKKKKDEATNFNEDVVDDNNLKSFKC